MSSPEDVAHPSMSATGCRTTESWVHFTFYSVVYKLSHRDKTPFIVTALLQNSSVCVSKAWYILFFCDIEVHCCSKIYQWVDTECLLMYSWKKSLQKTERRKQKMWLTWPPGRELWFQPQWEQRLKCQCDCQCSDAGGQWSPATAHKPSFTSLLHGRLLFNVIF